MHFQGYARDEASSGRRSTFQFLHQTSGKTYTLVGVQSVDVFARWIDDLLAGKEPLQAQPPEKAGLPSWARPEGPEARFGQGFLGSLETAGSTGQGGSPTLPGGESAF